MTVNLREIDDHNRAAVVALDVTDAQQTYVAGVRESLDDAAAYPHAAPRYWAIYDDDVPVGFVMISDDVPPSDDPEILGPYFLWRLLIDTNTRVAATGGRQCPWSSTTSGHGPARPRC